MRGTRLQLHWHEHEAFRFATAPDRGQDATFNANLAQLSALGLVFELQVFPNQLASALAARRGATRTSRSCSSTPACRSRASRGATR